MIAGNDYHPDGGNGRKEIVDLLQIPHQGLAVKQIAADKQAVRLHFPRPVNDQTKGILDGLGPFPSPGLVRIRAHAPMDVSCVDEFHNAFLHFSAARRNNSPYSSQLFTVLGNGITSRMLDIPVRYITQRSKPSPKPE